MSDILVAHLRSIDHMSVDDCFMQSPYFAKAADRIEDLQVQTMRLSGMVHDLKKEVAISDALLISEAEVSLERLARAEAAEAERDRLRDALDETAQILSQCTFETIRVHGQYIDRREAVSRARAALKGETP